MPIECRKNTQGGKGNRGKFTERDPNIVAAGLPTAQHNETVEDALKYYLLKDEVDALISDAIIPAPEPLPHPPLRKPLPLDMRNADQGQVAQLINPPAKTKFQVLVEDLKETVYKSYWKCPLSQVPDPVPMLPEGMDIVGTTFGIPTKSKEQLYDVIMPKYPLLEKTPPSKKLGAQTNRKYCSPPYDSKRMYGCRLKLDKEGRAVRCCLSDDRKTMGTASKGIMNTTQINFMDSTKSKMGTSLAPNNNIRNVPNGYSFGILKPPDNLPECISHCEINKKLHFFRKCIQHLNSVRRGLATIHLTTSLPISFQKFYLSLKFYDKAHIGWLSKDIIYKYCNEKGIRFDTSLIEPLLSTWKAFDGSKIKYDTFVEVLNHRLPLPELPKVPDVKPECLDYRTTYLETFKPGAISDTGLMAGIPSARYLDLDHPVKPEQGIDADLSYLPHETAMDICIAPSILTYSLVNHRDMFEKQEPDVVRRVFEAAGEIFTDDRFNAVWKEAQKLHSQGWVCYETFRQTLEKYPVKC